MLSHILQIVKKNLKNICEKMHIFLSYKILCSKFFSSTIFVVTYDAYNNGILAIL